MFMRAELGRLREGRKMKTGMSEHKLKDFAKGDIMSAMKKRLKGVK